MDYCSRITKLIGDLLNTEGEHNSITLYYYVQTSYIHYISSGRECSDRRSPIRRLYACLFVCPDQVLHENHVCDAPSLYKNMAEKMAATFARFTQLLTIEFPYLRSTSMMPMRLWWYSFSRGAKRRRRYYLAVIRARYTERSDKRSPVYPKVILR